jgi:hypothetical protein
MLVAACWCWSLCHAGGQTGEGLRAASSDNLLAHFIEIDARLGEQAWAGTLIFDDESEQQVICVDLALASRRDS